MPSSTAQFSQCWLRFARSSDSVGMSPPPPPPASHLLWPRHKTQCHTLTELWAARSARASRSVEATMGWPPCTAQWSGVHLFCSRGIGQPTVTKKNTAAEVQTGVSMSVKMGNSDTALGTSIQDFISNIDDCRLIFRSRTPCFRSPRRPQP